MWLCRGRWEVYFHGVFFCKNSEWLLAPWKCSLSSILGLEKWEQEFKNQIDALNVKGPALIQEDIMAIFQPRGSLKYDEFMKQMSEDADKSFKKAFVSKDYSFQNLVQVIFR